MIGFACKFLSLDCNFKTTTVKYLTGLDTVSKHKKLESLVLHNLKALKSQIEFFKNKPVVQRMFRISSDLCPLYTHFLAKDFYSSVVVKKLLETELLKCGDLARTLGVRLSFHPGQFCVLASESEQTVQNSILEFEYHCDMIRYMGFGKKFQDMKCNIHIGGKRGPDGIRAVWPHLSVEARNCLTIENAEFTWGLASSLELSDLCALVVDLHHYWIETGEHLQARDWRLGRVQDSWRGVRPVIHYSQSRLEYLECGDPRSLPDLKTLLAQGYTKAKLRAHSDDYSGNLAQNELAMQHHLWADIMLESKNKDQAWQDFCDFYI